MHMGSEVYTLYLTFIDKIFLKTELLGITIIGMGLQSAMHHVYFTNMGPLRICCMATMSIMLVSSSGLSDFSERIEGDQTTPAQTEVPARTTVKQSKGSNLREKPKASSADQVASMLARPLFEPGRRPSAPVQAQEPVRIMPRLAGIMIAPERSVAIFQQASSPRPIVLKTGDVLEGIWNIASIAAGEVTLAHDDTVMVLEPHSAANRDLPSPEPTRFWKVGLRRSDSLPSYLKRRR